MNRFEAVKSKNVTILPSFLKELMDRVADKLIPYQWEALNDRVEDAAPSYAIRNFKSAAGLVNAPHSGCVFQDSDLAKWIEAAGHMLIWKKDPETEAHIDEVVDYMEKAQAEDGYLNAYYLLNGLDKRFTNLRDNHELYCAGHMLEGAVAYYEATGKDKLLNIMKRYIDLIAEVFGPGENQKHGYPGHEEIELALVKLYNVTKEKKYLDLAAYFINERGKDGGKYFDEEAAARGSGPAWDRSIYEHNTYYQAGSPVREQKAALGHAVRQVYLLCGMADVARETGDETLKQACDTMWKDITRRQMYITGAVGQTQFGEAFTFDYDLPNDTVYAETCASIAMFFWAQRMLLLDAKGEYGDIMDTMLYNGTISGMNFEGNRFFYVNPLEVWPERSAKSQIIRHIRPTRQKWFGCACCPPNLARMLSALPGSVCTKKDDTLYMNLYASDEIETGLAGGSVKLSVSTKYPYDGLISININEAYEGFALALRLPGWVHTYNLTVNGKPVETVMDNGFVTIYGLKAGDNISYELSMPVSVVRAHPKARACAGKVAVRRGPVVYCMEQKDNGENLNLIKLISNGEFTLESGNGLPDGIVSIRADAVRENEDSWDEYELYRDGSANAETPVKALFIPYYAWNNRGDGEMLVWVREK